jgi:ketosteroid isomerase-like protein
MSDHENVTTVNAMTSAIVEQDHDTLAKLMTDDVVLHLRGPVPQAGDHEGVGGLLEAIGSLIESVNGDLQLEQQFCIGTDGWAAEWEHATLGRKGKTLESRNSFVYRFDGDRIDEMWMFIGAKPDQAEAFFA